MACYADGYKQRKSCRKRVYADRTHHGKEEDILFRFLEGKYLSEPDDRLMQELIADHVLGRQITRELVDANEQYRSGDDAALAAVTAHLGTLVEFYPRHIEKEDRDFFPASRAYMTDEEDQAMLAEMMEFDRKMIHEKYDAVVVNLEGQGTEAADLEKGPADRDLSYTT